MAVPDMKPAKNTDMKNAEQSSLRVPSWLVFVGGVPLLAAMGIEFLAVIGRNLGMPIPGSIELVQAAVLLSSSTAIVIATLSRAHARVKLLLDRAHGNYRSILSVVNAVGGVVFFLALATGGLWIAGDMLGAAEQSELLGVPWLPLRIFASVCMLITGLLYAGRAISRIRNK